MEMRKKTCAGSGLDCQSRRNRPPLPAEEEVGRVRTRKCAPCPILVWRLRFVNPPGRVFARSARILLARIRAENRGVLRACRLAGLDPKRSSSRPIERQESTPQLGGERPYGVALGRTAVRPKRRSHARSCEPTDRRGGPRRGRMQCRSNNRVKAARLAVRVSHIDAVCTLSHCQKLGA